LPVPPDEAMVSSPAAVTSGWAEAISHFLCCYIIKPPPWTLSNPGGGFFLGGLEFCPPYNLHHSRNLGRIVEMPNYKNI